MFKPDRTRLYRIAEKYKPENVTTTLIKDYQDSYASWDNQGNGIICHPPISSYKNLIAFLHECAHIILQHKIMGNVFDTLLKAKTLGITEQDIKEMSAYLQQEKQAWNYVEKIVVRHRISKFAWNYVILRSRENTKKSLQALCIIHGYPTHKLDHLVEW